MAGKRNPGALAGAAEVGMTFKAAELNVTPIHTTFDGELHPSAARSRQHIFAIAPPPLFKPEHWNKSMKSMT